MKKIEIIATGLKDIISLNEIQEPIEIELCGHMEHDGLTLNIYEVVKCVNESIHPVRVMIRTHNNGFNVSSEDINRMIDDIKYITKYCNPAGFVYGFLSDDQKKHIYDTTGRTDINQMGGNPFEGGHPFGGGNPFGNLFVGCLML